MNRNGDLALMFTVLMEMKTKIFVFLDTLCHMFFDINLKDRNFRRLDPTLMTTMIGYEDRQVNTRALTHA